MFGLIAGIACFFNFNGDTGCVVTPLPPAVCIDFFAVCVVPEPASTLVEAPLEALSAEDVAIQRWLQERTPSPLLDFCVDPRYIPVEC